MDAYSYGDVSVTPVPSADDPDVLERISVSGEVTVTITPGTQFRVTKPWIAGLAPATFERPYVRVEADIETDPSADGQAVLGLTSTFDGPELVVELAEVLDALLDGTLVPDEKMYARYTSF